MEVELTLLYDAVLKNDEIWNLNLVLAHRTYETPQRFPADQPL